MPEKDIGNIARRSRIIASGERRLNTNKTPELILAEANADLVRAKAEKIQATARAIDAVSSGEMKGNIGNFVIGGDNSPINVVGGINTSDTNLNISAENQPTPATHSESQPEPKAVVEVSLPSSTEVPPLVAEAPATDLPPAETPPPLPAVEVEPVFDETILAQL